MEDRITKAVVNYEMRLRLGSCGPMTERQVQRSAANYGRVYGQMELAVAQGREVLCTAGISTVWFPSYHAFTREIFKLTRRELSESALSAAYALAAEKWRVRGLDVAVLKQIGVDVFNLPWPATADKT